jgi:hypothetical protein
MPSAESMRPIACARLRSPRDAIDDARVLEQVVAHVANIEPAGADAFDVTIRVAFGTTGFEAGQLPTPRAARREAEWLGSRCWLVTY